MNNTKKLAGYKENADMRNGCLKAYENCYRRYAIKDCIDDEYEFGAMVQMKYICIHILKIDEKLIECVEKKIDKQLEKVTKDA